MKKLGKRITVLILNVKLLIVIWIIGGLFSTTAYTVITVPYEHFDSTQMLLTVGNDFTRKALLNFKLQKHIVKKGETLFRISVDYFVSVKALQSINKIADPKSLSVGKLLYIPPLDKSIASLQKYRIKPEDSINSLEKRYHITKEQFQQFNPKLIGSLKVGEIINLPRQVVFVRVNRGVLHSLIPPVSGLLTSRYGFRWGRMHYGLDLAAPAGTPVKAADGGGISFLGWRGDYGLLVIIDHGQYKTYYGHLSKILVTKGHRVRQGDIIGRVGATGRAYGSHLHFEVERNGNKLNPYYLLKKIK